MSFCIAAAFHPAGGCVVPVQKPKLDYAKNQTRNEEKIKQNNLGEDLGRKNMVRTGNEHEGDELLAVLRFALLHLFPRHLVAHLELSVFVGNLTLRIGHPIQIVLENQCSCHCREHAVGLEFDIETFLLFRLELELKVARRNVFLPHVVVQERRVLLSELLATANLVR